jgi:hypothetical protein
VDMGNVVFEISMSLDGFITAANCSAGEPMGDGGQRLHEWAMGGRQSKPPLRRGSDRATRGDDLWQDRSSEPVAFSRRHASSTPGQIRGLDVLVVTPGPVHTRGMTTSTVARLQFPISRPGRRLMREQPLPLDLFSLTRIGMGTWMTNLIVARKFAQAFREQSTLITGAMGGRALVRSPQID